MEKPEIKLPLDLKTIDRYLKNDLIDTNKTEIENIELGLPANRKDAENIGGWLEYMLTKNLEIENDPERLFQNTNKIYNTGLNEIIRQVSVHCKERGILLRKI